MTNRFEKIRFKNYKLRTKLLIMAVVVSLLPIVLVSYYNVSNSINLIEEAVYAKNQLHIKMTHERIHEYFKARETDALILASSVNISEGVEILNSFSADIGQVRRIEIDFRGIVETPVKAYDFTDIFITNKYNEVVYSLNYDKLDLSPLVFSNTFVEESMTGNQNWSELFRNSFIDDNILVLSTPIYPHQSANKAIPIGTLNMVLNQNALNELIHEGIDRVSANGDTFLIQKDGLLLTNTIQGAFKSESALTNVIETEARTNLGEAIESGDTDFNKTVRYSNVEGQPVIGTLTVTKIGDEFAGLVTEVGLEEAFGVLKGYKTTAVIIALIIIVLSMSFAIVISRSINVPINRIIGVINRISNYELNIDKESLKDYDRHDEIGHLERAILRISDNLILLLKEVDVSAEEVVASANKLHINALSSLDISTVAGESVNEIAHGSKEQAVNTDKALVCSTELSEKIGENQNALKVVVSFMEEVESLVGTGLNIVNQLNRINQDAMNTNKDLIEGINRSHGSFKEIEKVTELMMSIAERTNLLSLNASIEASRAGEHGLGFAVVSDEIRKLAHQSKEYSNMINDSILRMRKDNDEVQGKLNTLTDVSKNQMQSVLETQEKYTEIDKAMKEIQCLVNNLDAYQNHIDTVRKQVEDEIMSLSTISTQNAKASSAALKTIKTQMDIAKTLAISSTQLDTLSAKLKNEVSKFKY